MPLQFQLMLQPILKNSFFEWLFLALQEENVTLLLEETMSSLYSIHYIDMISCFSAALMICPEKIKFLQANAWSVWLLNLITGAQMQVWEAAHLPNTHFMWLLKEILYMIFQVEIFRSFMETFDSFHLNIYVH